MTPWQQMKKSAELGRGVMRQGELMKGSLAFASKRFADWTTRYFFASESERLLFGGSDLSPTQVPVVQTVHVLFSFPQF